jgi:hypothetical protein
MSDSKKIKPFKQIRLEMREDRKYRTRYDEAFHYFRNYVDRPRSNVRYIVQERDDNDFLYCLIFINVVCWVWVFMALINYF